MRPEENPTAEKPHGYSARSNLVRPSLASQAHSTLLNPTPEVLILGGGPAGAAASRLLAGWGEDVVLVERNLDRPTPPDSLAESLPPSIRKPLAATQLLAVVEAGDFHPNGGNTALWGGEARSDSFAGGETGFHVVRSRLDPLLRSSARAAGAQLVAGSARQAAAPGEGDLGTRIEVTTATGDSVLCRPKWTLDCTGRTGIIARRHRVLEKDAPTLAVVRRYRNEAGWEDVNATHALVESFENGWAWSVPTSNEERHVAMMVDPAIESALEGAGDLSAAFDKIVAETDLMRRVTERAQPLGGAWASTASMYTSERFGLEDALLVGDAASFVDPMSSYGVKKALASAWLAAIAVHTALRTPDLADVAVEFFQQREAEMYDALRGSLADQLIGPGGDAGEFWGVRRDWLNDPTAPGATSDGPNGLAPTQLRKDPDVLEAFAEIKQGSGRLELGREETVDRPMVMGNRLRMAPALVGQRFPSGVRHLRKVDLLRVVRLAPASSSPGALYESYCTWAAENDGPPVDLGDFMGILALLVAEGILVTGG